MFAELRLTLPCIRAETSQPPGAEADEMLPPLCALHQAQRDQAAARLGGCPGPAPGGVPGPLPEHPRAPGRIRLPPDIWEVPAKVGLAQGVWGREGGAGSA